ncbi:MAG: ferritin family protein [Planctomycetota bacterium]
MPETDLIQRAIDLERLSRDYYRQISRGPVARYAKEALEQLSREEQGHMEILAEYSRNAPKGVRVALPDASELAGVWKRFGAALESVRQAIQPHTDETTVVQRALDLEIQSLALYEDARKKTKSEAGRIVFSYLCDQESKHRAYLDRLLRKLLVLYEEPPEARPQL